MVWIYVFRNPYALHQDLTVSDLSKCRGSVDKLESRLCLVRCLEWPCVAQLLFHVLPLVSFAPVRFC